MRNIALFLLLFLTACASSEDSYQLYLSKKGLAPPGTTTIQHCHGYDCRLVTNVTLTPDDWHEIENIFTPPAQDAEHERAQIAKAIGLFERIIGPRDGTNTDIRGTFRDMGDDQLDCVDESTNTTLYLLALNDRDLIRFHSIEAPQIRWPLIDAGRWPHQTAVISDNQSHIPYVVDSWFHDNGADAEITTLENWKQGWKPASVHDLL